MDRPSACTTASTVLGNFERGEVSREMTGKVFKKNLIVDVD